MKKWLIVLLVIALVIVGAGVIFLLGSSNDPVETIPVLSEPNTSGYVGFSNLSYNGKYMSYPFNVDMLVQDGWYFYDNDLEGYPVLTNGKYPDVSITISDPNVVGKRLEDVPEQVNCLSFDFSTECSIYPIVLVKDKIGFNSTKSDVEEVLGFIAESDGYCINGYNYEFATIVDKDNVDIMYNITFVNGNVKSFTIKISNLIAEMAGE